MIFYGMSYGKRSNGGKETRAHRATAGTRLVAGEVVEVVHDGAAQMAEDEPEHGLESFLGCGRHAERVSQVGIASTKIVRGERHDLCPDWKKNPTQDPDTKPSLGYPPG